MSDVVSCVVEEDDGDVGVTEDEGVSVVGVVETIGDAAESVVVIDEVDSGTSVVDGSVLDGGVVSVDPVSVDGTVVALPLFPVV